MKKKILIISSSFYKDLEKNLLTSALKEIDKKLFDVNHFSYLQTSQNLSTNTIIS